MIKQYKIKKNAKALMDGNWANTMDQYVGQIFKINEYDMQKEVISLKSFSWYPICFEEVDPEPPINLNTPKVNKFRALLKSKIKEQQNASQS
jgi:hypothetical protein